MFDDKTQLNNQGNQGGKSGPMPSKPALEESKPPGNLPTVDGTEDIFDGVAEVDKPAAPMPESKPQRPSPFAPVATGAPPSAEASGDRSGDKSPDRSMGEDSIPLEKGAAVPQIEVMPPVSAKATADKKATADRSADKERAVSPEQMMEGVEEKKLSGGKKVLIIVLSVVLVAGLIGIGYWLYERMVGEEELFEGLMSGQEGYEGVEGDDFEEQDGEQTENGEWNIEDGQAGLDGGDMDELEPEEPIDTDGDGLTDEEEEFLGTNMYEPDSDGDGLPDRDEVEIYQTDPLNEDSDGDGYLDGAEVENGYDPKGRGKLLNLP